MAEIYLRSGSKVYQTRLNVGGKTVRRSTGLNCPTAAREEAERLEEQLNKDLLQASDLLLVEAAEKFLGGSHREEPYSDKTIAGYTTSLTNFVAVLGNIPLRLVDEERVEHYIGIKLRHGKHVQLKRDLAFLSSLLVVAKGWKCGVTSNPVSNVDKKGIRDARKRKGNLEPHQFDKLLAACLLEDHKRFLILGAFTGMRHQEIMKLEWSEIDMKARTITLAEDRTKNRCSREIPMHDRAYDTLSSTPKAQRTGYVFKGQKEGKPQNNFNKRFDAIRKRAGMPKVRIHDLRHTFASWLLQSGVPTITAQELLGHKTASMTDRYSHDNLRSKRRAVARVDLNTLSDTRTTDKKEAEPEKEIDFTVLRGIARNALEVDGLTFNQ